MGWLWSKTLGKAIEEKDFGWSSLASLFLRIPLEISVPPILYSLLVLHWCAILVIVNHLKGWTSCDVSATLGNNDALG